MTLSICSVNEEHKQKQKRKKMETKMANAQEGECEMASMLEDYDFLMPCLKGGTVHKIKTKFAGECR